MIWVKIVLLSLLVTLTSDSDQQRVCALEEIFPDAKFEYYTVQGNTIREIRKDISEKGPKDLFGNQRDAFTKWDISWKWPVKDLLPEYDKTLVSLKLTFVLPKKTTVLSSTDEKIFNRYFNSMLDHERTHAEKAVVVSKKLESLLRTLPKKHSSLLANKIATTELDELRAFDIDYDQKTHHGKFEGVYLDP